MLPAHKKYLGVAQSLTFRDTKMPRRPRLKFRKRRGVFYCRSHQCSCSVRNSKLYPLVIRDIGLIHYSIGFIHFVITAGNKNTTPISNMVSILLFSVDFINFLIFIICQLCLLHIQTVFIKQKVKYAHSGNAAIITLKFNIIFYDNNFFEGIFCF